MNVPRHKRGLPALTVAVLLLLISLLAHAQARPEEKAPPAEKVFKNVKVLTGISETEFMMTMGFYSAALGMNCVDCHVPESGGNWDKYAVDTPLKVTSRRMNAMVANINKNYFNGRRVLTCYSCHRGTNQPQITPSIAELYGPPIVKEPDQIMPPSTRGGSADAILDKYIQAVGGAQQLAKLTSFTAKGTYRGYADDDRYPVEVYAKAPAQRTTVMHGAVGLMTDVFDGKMAWQAVPAIINPVQVAELDGGELDGARLDAMLSFPGQIRNALRDLHAIIPSTIDGRRMLVVQGTPDGRYPVNLYFDAATGLLTRQVRFAETAVGPSPTQVDYADYRDVSGIKIPFRTTISWLDGRTIVELAEVQANAAVDSSKFVKPSAPKP